MLTEHAELKDTWVLYTEAWSESDAKKRGDIFARCLCPKCVYTDPHCQLNGYASLSDYMSVLQTNIPGVRFILKDFACHSGRSLANWEMVGGDGMVISTGTSYGAYGSDNRLTEMTGFFKA